MINGGGGERLWRRGDRDDCEWVWWYRVPITCQSDWQRYPGNLKERFFAKNSPLTWRKVVTRHSTRANAFLLWARNDAIFLNF